MIRDIFVDFFVDMWGSVKRFFAHLGWRGLLVCIEVAYKLKEALGIILRQELPGN